MQSLKRLLAYVKPYTLFAVLGPLLMCIEVGMDLLQPAIMQHIIDTGIANDDRGYVLKLGLLMLLAAVIGLIGGAGSSLCSTKAAVHFAADVRRDVFWKIEQFSSSNTDAFGAGKLITIVTNDIAAVQQSLMMTLRIFVRGPLLFIGSVIIVWFTARPLFPVLFVVIPVLMVIIYFFSAKSGKLFGKVQKALDQVNTKLQETLAGIRVIKAFDRQDYEKGQFRKVNDKLTKRTMSAEQVILTLMPIMLFIVNLGVVAGLWLGVIKVSAGTIQIGMILAFINYLNIIMNGLVSSSHVLMQITRSFPSAERIRQVLDTEADIQEPESPVHVPAAAGEVEFRNVSYSYSKNGEYVLKDISFRAKPGETIGIIGTTGSGKSTLAKLIPRLYAADSGVILLDGKDIRDYSVEQLRSSIGFVPQKATLFAGPIDENLRFGKEDATDAELEDAAEQAAAMEFIEKLEGRFRYEVMQGAVNLSGGQKQRLSMARAFIRNPKILILDDSTSAIDALSEAAVQSSLKERFEGSTVFIISSKISSVRDADQILVMEDGALAAQGKHEELLGRSQIYTDIYTAQSGKEVKTP
ncbi:ABC transporter ATP-binding protein [Bacillus massiliglaciei]|uniref:ABC transporter ATP-binding protein n=1 Tax=Bacillus massiliglaciei TaxID=1816693 RepID=UPI000AC705DF|nr:ABC transporter ATP-binding protein [Bacillus massiliglaciei]